MKFLKKNWVTILLTIIFAAGLCLLLYPTFANWWNLNKGAVAVTRYSDEVKSLDTSEYDQLLNEAVDYNDRLGSFLNRFNQTDEEHADYLNKLSVNGSDLMGSIQVPSVKIDLPIYHGTAEEVLQAGAGHLEGSSLPIGGTGTHTVITGHRGLPSAKLFTDLDQVVEGDYVILKVLNETLTYQIDTIRIVLPEEVESLNIDPEQDLCTLVTCTPYGVNTHRMLLTGHRVENLKEWTAVADAHQVDAKMVALFIAIPILILLFIVLMVRSRRPKGEPDEKA